MLLTELLRYYLPKPLGHSSDHPPVYTPAAPYRSRTSALFQSGQALSAVKPLVRPPYSRTMGQPFSSNDDHSALCCDWLMSTKGLVIVLWCLLIAGLHVTSASSVTLFLIGETSSMLRSVSKTTMGISYFVLGEVRGTKCRGWAGLGVLVNLVFCLNISRLL